MTELIAANIRIATPLVFAAMGGIFSERSGVVNIALEGMMLVGAYTVAAGTYWTGQPVVGLLMSIIVGILFAGIHAVACVQFEADAIVSGVALNLLALGVTEFGVVSTFGHVATSEQIPGFQEWSLGPLGSYSPLVFLGLLIVGVSYLVLFHTAFGLRLRACGEHPKAVRATGLSVRRLRYAGVLISGALAAIGGAFLVLDTHYFTRSMTAGRGYIALAAVIFGKWKPFHSAGACLLFGFAGVLQGRLQGWRIPSQLVEIIPYVLTMIVLAGAIGRATPPAALGRQE